MGNIWTNTVPKSNNKKKQQQSGQEICHQMLTLLLDQDTIYIEVLLHDSSKITEYLKEIKLFDKI